jgi:hypothetical protein
MTHIKRIGPPTPIGVRGTGYDLSVPLNAMPSADWRRTFQAPEDWKEPYHPSRITVKYRALIFTSEESHVGLWVQWIDKWIVAANEKCLPQAAQDEPARDHQRRLEDAAEQFKDL